jgi:hypothetical protein
MNNFEMLNRSKDQMRGQVVETSLYNSDQRMQDQEKPSFSNSVVQNISYSIPQY